MDISNLRFLVVDDMQLMRKIVAGELTRLGAKHIDFAEDGMQAIEVLKAKALARTPINFIVSDWNMPNMTGIELLKIVRKISVYKDVPFLMVTAEAEVHQVQEAIASGVDNYVVKPFTPAQFEAKLLAVCKKRFGEQQQAS